MACPTKLQVPRPCLPPRPCAAIHPITRREVHALTSQTRLIHDHFRENNMSTYKTILEPTTMRYAKPLAFPQAAFAAATEALGSDGHNAWKTAEGRRIHPKPHGCCRSRTKRRTRPMPCPEAA